MVQRSAVPAAELGRRVGPWPFDQPFFLLLSLAIGGDWPGNADDRPDLPATMLVDWITVRGAL